MGNNLKTDTWQMVEQLFEHAHSAQKVIPSGAAGVLVTSGGGAWALGAFSADIVPAGAITAPFDLHWVDVENPSGNASYEMVFYYGPTDIEAARVTFTRVNATTVSHPYHLQSVILPAGSRVRAKLMDSAGGNSTTCKIYYHTY